jgi:N-acetylmuramoyl-L-alanine amidase
VNLGHLRLFWLTCFLLIPISDVYGKIVFRKIDSKTAVVLRDRSIFLEIRAKSPREQSRGAELYTIVSSSEITRYKLNRGAAFSKPVCRVPFVKLNGLGKRLTIKELFPKDSLTVNGWRHVITFTGNNGETLWRLSDWFTGSPDHVKQIQTLNNVNPKRLGKGQEILIPFTILSPCFHWDSSLPQKTGKLTFKEDEKGIYAEYTLRYGQTIYSDAVMRFTPRINAQEVMAASKVILSRSGLKRFDDIPANTPLKIPLDMISPEFLPRSDPRRKQYDITLKASSKFRKKSRSKALEGITVILDSGHGGVDPGAIGTGKEKEDEYAYDVLCRVKLLLETSTKATVYTTIEDRETGYKPRKAHFLKSGKNLEQIRTHPPYQIKASGIALNLRWFLSNYIFSKHSKGRSGDEKVVFTSFHADSLHPKVNGLMIYIPGADYYTGNAKKTAKVYTSRREIKGRNTVRQSRKQRLKAEGFARAFAQHIITACKKNSIPLHREKPIRKFIIKKKRTWVPAVLKYCEVPTRLLIELVNLQNEMDRRRIREPEFRQKLAVTYVNALRTYFESDK